MVIDNTADSTGQKTSPASTDDAKTSTESTEKRGPKKKQGPLKILVVEDNPRVRRIMEILLIKRGFEVFTANDGQAGVQAALFLSNHDRGRVISLMDEDIGRAKMAALILLTLPGTVLVTWFRVRSG